MYAKTVKWDIITCKTVNLDLTSYNAVNVSAYQLLYTSIQYVHICVHVDVYISLLYV